MKEQKTSVGLDIVASVGRVFSLEAWQMLVPGLDPKSPPVLILSEAERDFYRRVLNATRDFKDTDWRQPAAQHQVAGGCFNL
jgi:hypothetical protein